MSTYTIERMQWFGHRQKQYRFNIQCTNTKIEQFLTAFLDCISSLHTEIVYQLLRGCKEQGHLNHACWGHLLGMLEHLLWKRTQTGDLNFDPSPEIHVNCVWHTKFLCNQPSYTSLGPSFICASVLGCHYNDVIMGVMASQITSLAIAYSAV